MGMGGEECKAEAGVFGFCSDGDSERLDPVDRGVLFVRFSIWAEG